MIITVNETSKFLPHRDIPILMVMTKPLVLFLSRRLGVISLPPLKLSFETIKIAFMHSREEILNDIYMIRKNPGAILTDFVGPDPWLL